MKKNILPLIILIAIIFIIVLIVLFTGNHVKDIDVKVLDIYDQNNQYFLNVSIKNNQDKTGWIADMYLSTVQGSIIDLTGAGAGYRIQSGDTIELTLTSAEVIVNTNDAPFYLTYTSFPSGNEFVVYI